MGKYCKKCSGKNHFAKMCRSKKKGVHFVEQNDSDSDNELFVGCLEMEINSFHQEWSETIKISNTQIDFQLDTGAMCNVISYETLENMNKTDIVRKSTVPLRSYSGHKIQPKGVVTLPCTHKNQSYDLEFRVVDKNVKPILGATSVKWVVGWCDGAG